MAANRIRVVNQSWHHNKAQSSDDAIIDMETFNQLLEMCVASSLSLFSFSSTCLLSCSSRELACRFTCTRSDGMNSLAKGEDSNTSFERHQVVDTYMSRWTISPGVHARYPGIYIECLATSRCPARSRRYPLNFP